MVVFYTFYSETKHLTHKADILDLNIVQIVDVDFVCFIEIHKQNKRKCNLEGWMNGKQHACQHCLHLKETKDLTFDTGSMVQAEYHQD